MNKDIQKLTKKSQEAMQAAARLAESFKNSVVEPEHLLLELVEQQDGVVPRILEILKIDNKLVITELNKLIVNLPRLSQSQENTYASSRLQKVFKIAEQEAVKNSDEFISTEHFLSRKEKTQNPARK